MEVNAHLRDLVNLRFIDDETEKVVHEERQCYAKRDDNENDPDDGLKQYVTDIERVDEFVFLHGAPLSVE
jgi:hypothetical protein